MTIEVNTKNCIRTRSFWRAMAVVLVGAAIIAGCGGDDEPTGPGGGENPALILPSGQAWTDRHEYGVGNSDGYIFAAGGACYSINDYTGASEGVWVVDNTCTWSANDSSLTIIIGANTAVFSYTVSGDILTFYYNVFKITADVNIADLSKAMTD